MIIYVRFMHCDIALYAAIGLLVAYYATRACIECRHRGATEGA